MKKNHKFVFGNHVLIIKDTLTPAVMLMYIEAGKR